MAVLEAEAERRFLAALVVTEHVEKEISGLARFGAGEATTDQPTDQADRAQQQAPCDRSGSSTAKGTSRARPSVVALFPTGEPLGNTGGGDEACGRRDPTGIERNGAGVVRAERLIAGGRSWACRKDDQNKQRGDAHREEAGEVSSFAPARGDSGWTRLPLTDRLSRLQLRSRD